MRKSLTVAADTPPLEAHFRLTEVMNRLHLDLTPFEDSKWRLVDETGRRVDTWKWHLVIVNTGGPL